MSSKINPKIPALSKAGRSPKAVINLAENRPGQRWADSLVMPDVNLRESLRIMDKASLRMLLVTDSELKLLGVVSDGDIRRGLINGVELHDPISIVMNNRPVTAPEGTSRDELLALMSRLDLLAIPLLKNGRLVGLQTLTQGLAQPIYHNPVFLMAGGGGTRLRPLTEDCPKPLLHVGDKPILEQIIRQFAKNGFRHFYISTHYIPEMIRNHFGSGEKWGVNIQYVHEDEPLGTAGALGLLPKNIANLPLIMMNGDVLTDIDFTKLLASHLAKKADATICVREYEHQIPYGVIENIEDEMVGMTEKPKLKFKINAGIYVINADIVKSVPKNQKIDMPTLLQQQINNNKKVRTYTIDEYWLDIGSMADFSRAQNDVKSLNL